MSQLKDIKEFEGKILYVDLWASWCVPCRKEFGYKTYIKNILSNHPDIEILYISLDSSKTVKAWRNCIVQYHLEGYHLLASQKLVEDIQHKVYQKDLYEIPRYMLIAPDGTILDKNLPRPSQFVLLKERIDELLFN